MNNNLKYSAMYHRVILVEGLDRLGKSTLIQNIVNYFGYYQVIHMGKPKALEAYTGSLQAYQTECFSNMFRLMHSSAYIIFDRAHLGEYVYSPLYRKYEGDYVFSLERAMGVADLNDVHLVLLHEDFSKSKHFVDDGLSFDISKREEEQNKFFGAFDKSIIRSKVKVCVTADDGTFKDQLDILKEAVTPK
jgi:hypothetical protein